MLKTLSIGGNFVPVICTWNRKFNVCETRGHESFFLVKFMFSKKATKIKEIFTVDLTLTT